MTVFATAMTSGILLALAAHIVSVRLGVGLTSIWRDLFPTDANAVRSAAGWWMIAGAGFAGSFLAGLLTQSGSGDQRPWTGLPRLTGILFFLVLAGAPYLAAMPTSSLPLALALGANLTVFALGTVTAFCGSWFALPREP